MSALLSSYDVLIADRDEVKTVLTRDDRAVRIERLIVDGSVSYRVMASAGDSEHVLIVTDFPDIASHIYDSHDGTFRPWDARYLPRGFNDTPAEGQPSKDMRVFAVGETLMAAAVGLADSLGYGSESVQLSHGEETDGSWEARITIDGTSFTVGGVVVPGGYVMTARN